MATKRSANALESEGRRTSNSETKRIRLSPTMDVNSNSSNPSSCSVSEDSALRSSPLTSDRPRQSSASSLQSSSGSDADSESYLSSSSEEDSSEDEASDEIITVGGPKRPHMSKASALDGAHDLQARLAALLPQLQAANEELAGEDHGWNMEDVEEGEQHIEMDLGLGVLEEQGDDSDSSDASSESDDESLSEDEYVGNRDERETNVMRKLMGQQKAAKKPAIEDLG